MEALSVVHYSAATWLLSRKRRWTSCGRADYRLRRLAPPPEKRLRERAADSQPHGTAAWSGVTDDGKEAAMANIKIAEATRTAQPASRPAVTVVVVSDYVEARQKSWTDERAVLRALGEQDFLESFEVILMENGTVQGSTPADLLSRCPGSRMEFSEATTSAELKDAGVMRANAPTMPPRAVRRSIRGGRCSSGASHCWIVACTLAAAVQQRASPTTTR
jgi:hypothetical protein